MNFIPSCDNQEDAVNSLARIYRVPNKRIVDLIHSDSVTKIVEYYSDCLRPDFLFFTSKFLESVPDYTITHAAYYHTTSYNGCESWFDESLLGAKRGIQKFLENISEHIPENMREEVFEKSSELSVQRSNYERLTSKSAGPYAWNTLEAASSPSKGFGYRIPEIIQDLWNPSGIGSGGFIDLSPLIEDKLKPVVVKFIGKTSCLNDYCGSLFAYLFAEESDVVHVQHTFDGNGSAIPQDKILELIDL